MKMRLFSAAAAAFIISVLASCSTLPPAQSEDAVSRVMDLINQRNAGALSSLSRYPFLLDTEMLMTESDIREFWNTLTSSGFTMELFEIQSIVPADQGAENYASTWMEEVFYARHLPRDAAFVSVTSGTRRIVLLLGGSRGGFPLLYGFRGGQS